MAVEIVSGPCLADWRAGVICPKCETKFVFDGDDLRKTTVRTGSWLRPKYAPYAYINCPKCRTDHDFAVGVVPAWVLDLVRREDYWM